MNAMRRLPVVSLRTSNAQHDIFKAYDSHENSFINNKPFDL
jgi:hypothetical protein